MRVGETLSQILRSDSINDFLIGKKEPLVFLLASLAGTGCYFSEDVQHLETLYETGTALQVHIHHTYMTFSPADPQGGSSGLRAKSHLHVLIDRGSVDFFGLLLFQKGQNALMDEDVLALFRKKQSERITPHTTRQFVMCGMQSGKNLLRGEIFHF